MRLIDADRLINWINEQEKIVTEKRIVGTGDSILTRDVLTAIQSSLRAFGKQIKVQPTAYDPEKIVEHLEDRSVLSRPVGWSKSYEIVTLEDAIEIVRQGCSSAESLQ